jgi:hypothetical protein
MAGREQCKLLPVPMELMKQFVQKPERGFPLLQRGFSSSSLFVEIDFDGAYQVIELPDPLVDRRFFLGYALLIQRTERGVRIERRVDLIPGDVEPDQYAELVEMLKSIDEREVEPIRLKRIGQSPVSPEAEEVLEEEPQTTETTEKETETKGP